MPARRHYRPTSALVTDLLFIAGPRNTRRHGRPHGCLWFVPRIRDYDLAKSIGREYAAHFVQFLQDNPGLCGSNLLGGIVMDMNLSDTSAAAGYCDGFFSALEQLICATASQCDVFAALDCAPHSSV